VSLSVPLARRPRRRTSFPNSSFAQGSANAPTGWSQDFWGTNTHTFTYPVAGHTDSSAAKVAITAYTNGDAKWGYDPITVTAGHSYTYTDFYQANIASTLEVEYTSTTGTQSYASATNFSASPTAWGTATLTFTAPAGTASARVFHYIAGVGTLTIDDVSLVDNAGGTGTGTGTSTNLVANPTFATGTANAPTSWSQGGWGTNTKAFTYPVTGKSDTTAAKVQITAYTSGDAKWVMNNVAVTAGASYTYTDAYQSNISSTVEIEYTSTTGTLSYASATNFAASPSAWGTSTLTFTPPTGTASVRIFHYIAGVGFLTIDDVSIVKN
jgi:hypothetical protein